MTTLFIGAVAYDPKVVTIWEGIRSYLREERKFDVEVVLFLNYGAQVAALLSPSPRIDIAWNTNLAFVQAAHASNGAAKGILMRDTDVEWISRLFVLKGSNIRTLEDLRGKTVALGSRDSGHAAILPVHFLAEAGLREGEGYKSLRFDSDVGKHGDTGRSELEVLKAVLEGKADAGVVGSPFFDSVEREKLVPKGALDLIWSSPAYSHCMFTTRPTLEAARADELVTHLTAMSWDNPVHRPILESEGLKTWVRPSGDGYASLRAACERFGLLDASRTA